MDAEVLSIKWYNTVYSPYCEFQDWSSKRCRTHRHRSTTVLSRKESACQYRSHQRCGFDPWIRKLPWRRAWQPTPVFLPLRPLRGLQETRVATREESGVLGFPSRSKASILRRSAFFTVQLSHPYMTTGKTTRRAAGESGGVCLGLGQSLHQPAGVKHLLCARPGSRHP